MADSDIEMPPADVAEAQDAIRSGDIMRLTQVDDDAGEFTMRLLVEGEPTIDGRYFTDKAVEWRELPLPLMMKKANTGDGHKESVACGAIMELWREGNEIWGRGHFSATEDGQTARQLINEGVLNGVSADVGGASSEFEVDEESGSKMQRISKGVVMGATVLPLQAFSEARIAVTASAYPVDPPREWFDNPKLERGTALTVTDEGHVFGHLATWDTCHVGIQGRCQMAPRSMSDYAYFAHGEIKTKEGDRLRTGRITLGTGHAALSLSADAAKEHYDDTGAVVADIAVGEDSHGVWFSGALRPDVTPAQVRELRASAVSGDWRAVSGNLELMALLAVNTPGFPVPRLATLAASAAGEEDVPFAMISASVLPEGADAVTACGCGGSEVSLSEDADEEEGSGTDDDGVQMELFTLERRMLSSEMEFIMSNRPPGWNGRCHNRGYAAANPDKCGGGSPMVSAPSRKPSLWDRAMSRLRGR
jgi:hypothetical protein